MALELDIPAIFSHSLDNLANPMPTKMWTTLQAAGALAAVSNFPTVRFICHFLIGWLAALAGGAHAVAEAGHEARHALNVAAAVMSQSASAALSAINTQAPSAQELEASHDKAHPDSCNHSHCDHSHATDMLPTLEASLPDTCRPATCPSPGTAE